MVPILWGLVVLPATLLATEYSFVMCIDQTSSPVQEVIDGIRAGLHPLDRLAVRLETAARQCRSAVAVAVNSDHQSLSINFQSLLEVAQRAESGAQVRVAFRAKSETFASYVGKRFANGVALVPFRTALPEATTDNYVGDGVLGQTLFPITREPLLSVWYGISGDIEIHVSVEKDLAERAVTFFEELRTHVVRFQRGQSYLHGDEDVDQAAVKSEEETRQNLKLR